ncbi:hypothetical protein ALC57_17355 [Trachymyrmex cornetzi]|uniref:Uncharacterized protein n=1 Tax=Trachymyrmex cornetzi TaxID=471704 RepID=A0A195DCZ4_9HYME|nr:hypothetical protein ALC57_17355 [Trachymyrmex cornetzi]
MIRCAFLPSTNVERCLGVNRSRGDILSCAFVVLTLTAAETQLTKGFSLSPAATPRHSAVASGKATDFPSARTMCEEGWRASILPTITATTLSATTSIPQTGGGSAAPAVLQKLGHPHLPLHASPPRGRGWRNRCGECVMRFGKGEDDQRNGRREW